MNFHGKALESTRLFFMRCRILPNLTCFQLTQSWWLACFSNLAAPLLKHVHTHTHTHASPPFHSRRWGGPPWIVVYKGQRVMLFCSWVGWPGVTWHWSENNSYTLAGLVIYHNVWWKSVCERQLCFTPFQYFERYIEELSGKTENCFELAYESILAARITASVLTFHDILCFFTYLFSACSISPKL